MEKRYDHKKAEPATQQLWEEQQSYKAEHNPGPLFSIDTPPPTVSGSLHVGHIFSYTQTDICARYKRMSGKSVFYPMGFDDNGLPTERYVEKKRGISSFKLGRAEFIKQCLEETALAAQEFKKLWQAMGLSVDWSKQYSTISPEVQKISQESFIRLYNKGFIYRKHEPALFCTACRTSVAQAELDDVEKETIFNDIAFTSEDGAELIIGTTRPELLPSCVALFYHPDDTRYTHLAGKKANVPLFNFQVPILADATVNPEKGTGLVMCCTFGDKTDIAWFKQHNLPYKQSIGFDGKFGEQTGFLAGLKVPEARKLVLEELQKNNLIRNQRKINHAVNTHERCKKEIEYLALQQWFLNILDHKDHFLAIGEKINWFPKFMHARYKNWVENISWDWCLSRQRFYGIPFPVWYCNACKHTIVPEIKDLPLDPQTTNYNKGVCPKCSSADLIPDTDVMDTWNTSSLTPYICYQLFNPDAESAFNDEVKEFIPMSIRPQAHDIIRTWAFDTIVKTSLHNDIKSWHDIVISGHVLADDKNKLSKSKGGNKLAPETLLNTYPADVIRFWTASGSLGHDVSFSENQLKIGQRLVTKLWNAFLFVREHIQDVPNSLCKPEYLDPINEWLLHQASTCFANYTHYFKEYEFSLALQNVESFFWHNFCDNYLEIIKHQLFNPDQYSEQEVAATRWTLYTVGLRILQLYAPYIPHVTEAIYQELYKDKEKVASLHQTRFTAIQHAFNFETSKKTVEKLIEIISTIRKLKTEKQLSLKTELASLTLYSNDQQLLDLIRGFEKIIRGITHAKTVLYTNEAHDSARIEQENDLWHIHSGI